jgi:hypothetical protein
MDQGNVLSHFLFLCCVQGEPHFLFQFQVRLLFDALERSYRDISVWTRNRHTPRLGRMLELDMASLLGDLNPAIRLEAAIISLGFMRIYTHGLAFLQVYKYTCQQK